MNRLTNWLTNAKLGKLSPGVEGGVECGSANYSIGKQYHDGTLVNGRTELRERKPRESIG